MSDEQMKSVSPDGINLEVAPKAEVEKMDVDQEDGAVAADDEDDDPIDKMREMEILPDLFNLLHDLQNGTILAKDFDNNAGSLRLKLTTLRQYLQEVEGINELIKSREAKIESLRVNNAKRYEFLSRFKEQVQKREREDAVNFVVPS